jgi:hypothetical protein
MAGIGGKCEVVGHCIWCDGGETMILGDLATWVTGIATIALFVIGFIQIRNERKARIKRENELEDLKKRDQADHISCWIVRENLSGVWIAVLNQSPQPIYQVIVSVVVVSQEGENQEDDNSWRVCISAAPPGQGYTVIQASYHGMSRRPGVEIAFKDRMGKNWIRKANGELVEIKESPMRHYDISLPALWNNLNIEFPSNET